MDLEETTARAEDAGFSTRNNKNLTNEQRLAVYQFLLKESNNGRLQRGSVPMAAQRFSISEITVKRIWKRGKESQGKVDVYSRKPGRVGGKPIEVDLSKIYETPLQLQTNIHILAKALNVSSTTLRRRMKEAGRSWVGAKNVPGLVVTAPSLDGTTVRDVSEQNNDPCIAKKFVLDDMLQDYPYTQEMAPQVESDPTLQNREPEKYEQLTTPHIDGAHSCQDVFEGDRIDTSGSQEQGNPKKRKRVEDYSSDTVNKPLSASNADVDTYAPCPATLVLEESAGSHAAKQLEKAALHIGCLTASDEENWSKDENAVKSRILNLDCGAEKLENPGIDKCSTHLVDELKRLGFDDSDGKGTGMVPVLEDCSDHDESAIGKGSYSPCEPSMKDDVGLDLNTPADKSASGSVLKSFMSEPVALWGSSEAAACIETKNIYNDDDNEMANTIKHPKGDRSAFHGNQNMEEGRNITAVPILYDLARINGNDSIDGAKDSLSHALVHEPEVLSYFADSHDGPGECSQNTDVVDKILSPNGFNRSQVLEQSIKETNFYVSMCKGLCELAKRKGTIERSLIRDTSIFNWDEFYMHDTSNDGVCYVCKRETKDGNGSDSKIISGDLKAVKEGAEKDQEVVISDSVIAKYGAGFGTSMQKCIFCDPKIPGAEPPDIHYKLASMYVFLEKASAYVMADVASEESEQPTLPQMGRTGRNVSKEDDMKLITVIELMQNLVLLESLNLCI